MGPPNPSKSMHISSANQFHLPYSFFFQPSKNNLQAIEISILDTIKLFLDLCRTPIIRSSGVSLIRRILQQQMRYVYRNLTTPRILLQQSTLKLLVSMNSFSSATTRELMDTFNFQLNVCVGSTWQIRLSLAFNTLVGLQGFTKFCNFRRKDNNNATSWKYGNMLENLTMA